MNHYYISSKNGTSGICKYSKDFYDLVLKQRGYEFVDSTESFTNIFTQIPSKSNVHIEIGIFQNREIEILLLMLQANYKNVSITLHDAPLLKYPVKAYEKPLLNKASKFYDRYVMNFKNTLPFVSKLKSIYVLSEKGASETKKLYGTDNIHFMPHVLNTDEISVVEGFNRNFLYFGFIGRNKGIEYALEIHQEILRKSPDVQFYVIGTAIGAQMHYFEWLKKKYSRNVHYMGYVPEEELDQLFAKATFAMILFRDYKFFYPTSGSILQSLKKGKIVVTNNVNAVSELVTDNQNGIILTGDIERDSEILLSLYTDSKRLTEIAINSERMLRERHSPETVTRHLRD